MKSICTIFLLTLFFSVQAQERELVIFSNTGEPFYVVLNGSYQNDQPATNVRVRGLRDQWYDCEIISRDNIFTIRKNLAVSPGKTVTYKIKETDNGYKMRYFSESPLNIYQPTAQQTVFHYHVGQGRPTGTQTSTTQTTTTQTTTVHSTPQGGDVINMNIQVGENGMSTNISTNDGMNSNGSVTHTETTTTTVSTNGGYDNQSGYNNNNYGCSLDNAAFSRLKSSIQAESFEDDKLRVANQAAQNKCLSVYQVKEIASLFDFAEEKLAFTKAAYGRCVNRSEYYEVLEVFTFSEDKEELEQYMQSH